MTKSNADIAQVVADRKAVWSGVRRADLARQIRGLMREKGLLNKDLAERMGVTEANVSRMLKGRQNFQLETLYMIADAMEEILCIAIGEEKVKIESHAASDSCAKLSVKQAAEPHESFTECDRRMTAEIYIDICKNTARSYARTTLKSKACTSYVPSLMSIA